MERLEFNSTADLGIFLYNLSSTERATVTAVLYYKKTHELLRWIMRYSDIELGHINFKNNDSEYDKEYYITLSADSILNVEPANRDFNYIRIDTDALFLDGDANSKISTINSGCLQFELDFSVSKTNVDI